MFFKKYKEKIKHLEDKNKTLQEILFKERTEFIKYSEQAKALERELLELKRKEKHNIQVSKEVKRDVFLKIIKAGRNSLVKKHHPDKGGNAEDFRLIEDAYKELCDIKLIVEKNVVFRNPFDDQMRAAAAAQRAYFYQRYGF